MRQDRQSVGVSEEGILPLKQVFSIIRSRLYVILAITVVLVGTTVGFSLVQTPMYEASAKVLIGQDRGISESPNEVAGLQELTQTMAEGVNSRPVAAVAIQELGLQISPEDLLENVTVQQVGLTQFIQIDYRDADPQRAQQVANAMGQAFSARVSDLPSRSAISATTWEPAVVPEIPASPNPIRNGLVALAMGLLLGVALSFLLETLSDRLRSPEEAEQATGIATLGLIPEIRSVASRKAS